MANVDRILIVGGGIAGLSLATALHRQGYSPELIERSTAWPAVGAGVWALCCLTLTSALTLVSSLNLFSAGLCPAHNGSSVRSGT